MPKRSIVALALLSSLLLAIQAQADRKTVTYQRDGQTLTVTGDVVETDTGYSVKTDAETVSIRKADVVKIEDPQAAAEGGPADEYARRRAAVAADDVDALYQLASWGVDNKLYTQAKADLEAILKKDPNNIRASLLLKKVNSLIDQQGGDTNGGTVSRDNTQLISLDDIYKIRRAELRDNEPNLAIQLKDDLARRFAKAMSGLEDFKESGFEEKFLSWPALRQARYIMAKTNPGNAFRDDIIIRSDPGFMRDFTREVWPVVLRNCASGRCHGAPRARGGLKFYPTGNDERTRYTNFVMLDGVRNRQGLPLLNRSTPDDSLLLEYLLPRDIAKVSHPTRLPPLFRDRDSRQYKQVAAWIGSLEHFPQHPDYELKYEPPQGVKLIFRDKSGLQDLLPPKQPEKAPAPAGR